MRQIAGALTRDNHAIAIELARLPQTVRGFGHVKARNQASADYQPDWETYAYNSGKGAAV